MKITPGWLGKWGALCVALLLNLHPLTLYGQGEPFRFREVHLGLEVQITAHGPRQQVEEAAVAAFERIAGLEQILSDWRPGSDLNLAVVAASQGWTPIGRELMSVLQLALEVASASDGAFDPTVGALTRLWRDARRTGVFATAQELAAARSTVGWHNLLLDTTRHQMKLTNPGTLLDLGGIAKGWILQDAMRVMQERGVGTALIEAGGDLVAGNAPPDSDGWRINVRGEHGDSIVLLHDAAMATSGPSSQSIRDSAGHSQSHVIDPAVGTGLHNGVEVTVMTRDGAVADAVATALTILPRSKWAEVLRRFDVKLVAVVTRHLSLRSHPDPSNLTHGN